MPGGAQNFFEWTVESVYGLLESIIGAHLVKKTFWFFGTIFIFILAANWIGLLPGVGTIGWGHQTEHGFVIDQPLLRGANADLNLTLAMALVFFACWIVWAFQEVGARGVVKELFGAKGETTGFMKPLIAGVFVAAGLLEIVSILFRPDLLELPPLRQRLRRREHARDDVADGSGARLAPADSLLLHGAAGRPGAGDGVHAAHRRLHASHLPSRRTPT